MAFRPGVQTPKIGIQMVNITIHPRTMGTSSEEVAAFFSDLQNLEALMPESVSQFEATPERCFFKLGNLGRIGLERASAANSAELIGLRTVDNKPFAVELHINLSPVASQETQVGMHVQADMNPFMQMMAAKPLEQFLGHLLKKLAERYATN